MGITVKDSIQQPGNRLTATKMSVIGTHHEEVQPGEGNQVDSQLAQVSIQLAGEAQAAGHARHHGADEVVQVAEGGGGQLQGPEADVVQGLQEVWISSGPLRGKFGQRMLRTQHWEHQLHIHTVPRHV